MSKFKGGDCVGEISYSRFNTPMKLIEYHGWDKVLVEFQDEYKYRTYGTYQMFKKGNIKNVYDKSVYNVGFIGEGKYNNILHRDIYVRWFSMMSRCYNPYRINNFDKNYVDCFVDVEFHNFQKFAKWYEENYYTVDNETMHLDKDILVKHNKIYSKETMIFVPEKINILFNKNNRKKRDLPIGVIFNNKTNKFVAQCGYNNNGKREHVTIGYYDSKEEAFLAYKRFKENYIKEFIIQYKNKIPDKIYNAIYNYTIEIDD